MGGLVVEDHGGAGPGISTSRMYATKAGPSIAPLMTQGAMRSMAPAQQSKPAINESRKSTSVFAMIPTGLMLSAVSRAWTPLDVSDRF